MKLSATACFKTLCPRVFESNLNFKRLNFSVYKPRVSNKEEGKKRLNYFERLGFLIEIDKCSIKMVFQPKIY